MTRAAREELDGLGDMDAPGLRLLIKIVAPGEIDIATDGYLTNVVEGQPSMELVAVAASLRLQADALVAVRSERDGVPIEQYEAMIREQVEKFHRDFDDPVSDTSMSYRETDRKP